MTTIRRDTLAVCIALAFASGVAQAAVPATPGSTTWTVENCNDDGPGSLRQVLSTVASNDTVDLTSLACSTITLTSGELVAAVDNLTLVGPAGGVEIDAAGSGRVLSHTGTGSLLASYLSFVNGSVVGDSGGCIHSLGGFGLRHGSVRGCSATASSDTHGGGIYAVLDVGVSYSTITDNAVILSGGHYWNSAHGGGIAAGRDVSIVYSTISGNSVVSGTVYSDGGGFWSGAGAYIRSSTISANDAFMGGAGRTFGGFGEPAQSDIIDSTISGNTAAFRNAGIESWDSLLRIHNSTIAFNTVAQGFGGVGLVTFGLYNTLYLESSIVAGNTRADGTPDDICWQGGDGSIGGVFGTKNLIIASWNGVEPGDTIHVDPLLAPLADNGGPTLTHALQPASPAIDRGSDALGLTIDQRGLPRVSGIAADIGAFEVQQPPPPDAIFRNGFEAPG